MADKKVCGMKTLGAFGFKKVTVERRKALNQLDEVTRKEKEAEAAAANQAMDIEKEAARKEYHRVPAADCRKRMRDGVPQHVRSGTR